MTRDGVWSFGQPRAILGDCPDEVAAKNLEEQVKAVFDACEEGPMWAAELISMATTWETSLARADLHYKSHLARRLREAAGDPPSCEEAFRYRLCVLMDWSPKHNEADLDAAVARARGRVR